MPPWFLEAPEVDIDEYRWLEVFHTLSSCRPAGMSVMPIPWTIVMEYCDRVDIAEELRDPLWRVIRIIDEDYLQYIDEERQRNDQLRKKSKK